MQSVLKQSSEASQLFLSSSRAHTHTYTLIYRAYLISDWRCIFGESCEHRQHDTAYSPPPPPPPKDDDDGTNYTDQPH